MEEPQKSVLRLMLNRIAPPEFEELFTLLERISLQDEYPLFFYFLFIPTVVPIGYSPNIMTDNRIADICKMV